MSRRRRKTATDGAFDGIVEMSSILPWWLTCVAAMLLFIFVPTGQPEVGDSFATEKVIGSFLGLILGAIFKYLVPFALLLGGMTNLFKRGKSAWIFKNISTHGVGSTLQKLSWKDFEFLVAEHFKKEGYQVDLINAQGADGGVDIKLYKDGGLYLVQCKHYKAWKVSVTVVRELLGVMAVEGAIGGYVITTGKFTEEARSFAKGKSVELIDGSRLEKLLNTDRSRIDITRTYAHNICPRCGRELVVRNGSRGKFWGCSSFPKCRFTKNIT